MSKELWIVFNSISGLPIEAFPNAQAAENCRRHYPGRHVERYVPAPAEEDEDLSPESFRHVAERETLC